MAIILGYVIADESLMTVYNSFGWPIILRLSPVSCPRMKGMQTIAITGIDLEVSQTGGSRSIRYKMGRDTARYTFKKCLLGPRKHQERRFVR